MASVDPTEIHPEYDALTPDNWDQWEPEDRERYLEAKESALSEEAEKNRVEMAADEKAALETLRSATQSGAELTKTVDLADGLPAAADPIPVDVTVKMTGELEATFDRISDQRASDDPRLAELKDAVIDAILTLIVDDPEPSDDPIRWDSRQVWEAFYYDEGMAGLLDVFDVLSDPALTRYEQLGNSRGRTRQ